MGLDGTNKPVTTPGIRRDEELGDDQELSGPDATAYRAMVARGNYLAQDRSDIQFTIKELSRTMASPTIGDWKDVKRLARYLSDKRRVRVRFGYQE